jgi:hypothetical protein
LFFGRSEYVEKKLAFHSCSALQKNNNQDGYYLKLKVLLSLQSIVDFGVYYSVHTPNKEAVKRGKKSFVICILKRKSLKGA